MSNYMGVTNRVRSGEGMLTGLLVMGLVAGALLAMLVVVLLQGSAFVRGVLDLLPL